MKMTAEQAVLQRMGIAFEEPAPGCCGMAGSFGFEPDKYDVSTAVGELELLPAVRHASPDCLIIADGFSCREQIAQCTQRNALHLAEVIHMALQNRLSSAADGYPERSIIHRRQVEMRQSMQRAGLGMAAIGAATALLYAFSRRR